MRPVLPACRAPSANPCSNFDELTLQLNDQLTLIGVATKIVRTGREEAEAALAGVRQGSEAVGRDMAALGDRATGLGSHLDGLRTAVTAGVQDVITQTDRLQKRSETISGTLSQQGRQIEAVLGQAGEVATVLSASGTLARETSSQMRDSVRSLSEDIAQVAGAVRAQEDSLAATAKSSLAALRETAAGLDEIISRSGSSMGTLDRKAGEISFAVATSLNLHHRSDRAASPRPARRSRAVAAKPPPRSRRRRLLLPARPAKCTASPATWQMQPNRQRPRSRKLSWPAVRLKRPSRSWN